MYKFRSYMKNVKHIDWIDESNNDESNSKSTTIIYTDENNRKSTTIINNDNSNTPVKVKTDKRCKVKNEDVKSN